MITYSIICSMTIYVALALTYKGTPNVGTVLFSRSDVNKTRWSERELGILLARKHFQGILPPPVQMSSWNDEYLATLLNYFKNAYTTLKSESIDLDSEIIMTTALSDTIGGYLKALVVPITKIGYYSGTISQNNALEVFQLYNDIKGYLDTDGGGWCRSNINLLNSIPIKVASPKHVLRSMKDPCDYIAYYEKTPTGLSVAIPDINWDTNIYTMFIPLKDVTLVPIKSKKSSDALIHYYDVAKSCLQETNPFEVNNFDDRFQYWLNRDVLPHLKDNNLYLALESVLSLVNSTQNLCDTVLNIYSSKDLDCTDDATSYSYLTDISYDESFKTTTKLVFIAIMCLGVFVFCRNIGLEDFCKELNNRRNKNVRTLASESGQTAESGESESQTKWSSSTNDSDSDRVGLKPSMKSTRSEFISERSSKKSLRFLAAAKKVDCCCDKMRENENTGMNSCACFVPTRRDVGANIQFDAQKTKLNDQNIKLDDQNIKLNDQNIKPNDQNKKPNKYESESATDCACDNFCHCIYKAENTEGSNNQTGVLQNNKQTGIDATHDQVKKNRNNQGLKLTTGKPVVITLDIKRSPHSVLDDENKWKLGNPRPTKGSKIPVRTLIARLLYPKRILGPVHRHVRTVQHKNGVADDLEVINNRQPKKNNKLNITM